MAGTYVVSSFFQCFFFADRYQRFLKDFWEAHSFFFLLPQCSEKSAAVCLLAVSL